jgi:hypothetical protein
MSKKDILSALAGVLEKGEQGTKDGSSDKGNLAGIIKSVVGSLGDESDGGGGKGRGGGSGGGGGGRGKGRGGGCGRGSGGGRST